MKKSNLTKLKNAVDNVVAVNNSYAEEQRQAAVRSSIRFAAADAVQTARAWSGTTADEDALVQSIAESFYNIVGQEVKSHAQLLCRIKQAEMNMDFMTKQLERRETIAGEHRTEMLRELQVANEQVRSVTDKYNELLEQFRLQKLRVSVSSNYGGDDIMSNASFSMAGSMQTPSRKSMSGVNRRSTLAAATDADVAASLNSPAPNPDYSPRELEGSPQADTRLLSTKLENEWLTAIKEEEFSARESQLSYESEKKLKALQVKLKREQDVLVYKTNRRMEDTLKIETTKLENKVRQLESQLRKKEVEAEQVMQRERERWRAQTQRLTDNTKAYTRNEIQASSMARERAAMAMQDEISQNRQSIHNITLERDRAKSAVQALSTSLDQAKHEVAVERDKVKRERKEHADKLKDMQRRHNVEKAGFYATSALANSAEAEKKKSADLVQSLANERKEIESLKVELIEAHDLTRALRDKVEKLENVNKGQADTIKRNQNMIKTLTYSKNTSNSDSAREEAAAKAAEMNQEEHDLAILTLETRLEDAEASKNKLQRQVTSLKKELLVSQAEANMTSDRRRASFAGELEESLDDEPTSPAKQKEAVLELAKGLQDAENLLDMTSNEIQELLAEERRNWTRERTRFDRKLAANDEEIVGLREKIEQLEMELAMSPPRRGSNAGTAAGGMNKRGLSSRTGSQDRMMTKREMSSNRMLNTSSGSGGSRSRINMNDNDAPVADGTTMDASNESDGKTSKPPASTAVHSSSGGHDQGESTSAATKSPTRAPRSGGYASPTTSSTSKRDGKSPVRQRSPPNRRAVSQTHPPPDASTSLPVKDMTATQEQLSPLRDTQPTSMTNQNVFARSMAMVQRMQDKRQALLEMRKRALEKVCVTSIDDNTLLAMMAQEQYVGMPASNYVVADPVNATETRSTQQLRPTGAHSTRGGANPLSTNSMEELVAKAQVSLSQRSMADLIKHMAPNHAGAANVTSATIAASSVQAQMVHASPDIDFTCRSMGTQTEPITIASLQEDQHHKGSNDNDASSLAFPAECFAYYNNGVGVSNEGRDLQTESPSLMVEPESQPSSKAIVLLCKLFHQRLSVTEIPVATHPFLYKAPPATPSSVTVSAPPTTADDEANKIAHHAQALYNSRRVLDFAQASAARFFRSIRLGTGGVGGGNVVREHQQLVGGGGPSRQQSPQRTHYRRNQPSSVHEAADAAIRQVLLKEGYATVRRTDTPTVPLSTTPAGGDGRSVGNVHVVTPCMSPPPVSHEPQRPSSARPARGIASGENARPSSAVGGRPPSSASRPQSASRNSPRDAAATPIPPAGSTGRKTPGLKLNNNPYRTLKATGPVVQGQRDAAVSAAQQQQPASSLVNVSSTVANAGPIVVQNPSITGVVDRMLHQQNAGAAPASARRPPSARSRPQSATTRR